MRILFHSSRDLVHPNAGGSEVYMDHVMQGLHQRGHTVHLSVGRPAGKHLYQASESGGTFTQFPMSPLRLLRNRKKYDLVVDVANGMTYYSPLVRSGPTICLVHHIHTSMWSEWFSPPVAAFGRFLERRMMPLVYRKSTFVAVSDSTKDELVELGVASSNIEIVHNATLVPEVPVAEEDHEPLFVAVGRLVPHKQLHLLLEAWPKVRQQTGGRLVIVGEGPERTRLEGLLSDGASLLGKIPLAERDDLLARATALLHPSHVEGWGLVVMEAAAQQTPTIGFNVAGVRDSVRHGETGWLCDSMDEYTDRWIAVAEDRSSTTLAGKRAREWSENFGVARMVDAFEAVAVEVVEAHQTASAGNPAPASL